jgi:pimeloyl-ACP methyl ester carboxylesterase
MIKCPLSRASGGEAGEGAVMPIASVNDVQIYYEEAGSGTPLIFSHEFAGSWESWDDQMRFFARRYRVIAYNHRGYPPSSVPDTVDDYSEEQNVADLRGLLDALAIERAFLCGLSMGGTCVLKLALAAPQRCLGLIVAGAGSGSADRAAFSAQTLARLAAFDSGDIDAAVAIITEEPNRVQLRAKDPVGQARFVELLRRHSPRGSANTLRGVQLRRRSIYEVEDALRGLDVPVLVLVGDEDESCIGPALLMKRTLPNCGVMMFPRSGHAINLEEPDLFNRAVLDFLTAVEQGAWRSTLNVHQA